MFRKLLLILVIVSVVGNSSYAMLPVIDATNLPQNVMQAVNTYNMYVNDLLILDQQRKDFEYTIKNTLAPGFWVWDTAVNFDDNMKKLVKPFQDLANGGLEDYFKQYYDVDFYRNSPCFRLGGCSDAELEKIKKNQRDRLEAMRKTSKETASAIEEYVKKVEKDKQAFYKLTREVKKTQGLNESVGYSNQILVLIYDELKDINGSVRLLQRQIQSAIDISFQENAIDSAIRDDINSAKLNTKIKGLNPRYRYPNLR